MAGPPVSCPLAGRAPESMCGQSHGDRRDGGWLGHFALLGVRSPAPAPLGDSSCERGCQSQARGQTQTGPSVLPRCSNQCAWPGAAPLHPTPGVLSPRRTGCFRLGTGVHMPETTQVRHIVPPKAHRVRGGGRGLFLSSSRLLDTEDLQPRPSLTAWKRRNAQGTATAAVSGCPGCLGRPRHLASHVGRVGGPSSPPALANPPPVDLGGEGHLASGRWASSS